MASVNTYDPVEYLEQNYNMLKSEVQRKIFSFLYDGSLHIHHLPAFLTKLFDDDRLEDDALYSFFLFACCTLNYNVIDLFLKKFDNIARVGRVSSDFSVLCRIEGCCCVLEPMVPVYIAWHNYRHETVELVMKCLSRLFEGIDPQQILEVKEYHDDIFLIAIEYCPYPEVCKLLIDFGANPYGQYDPIIPFGVKPITYIEHAATSSFVSPKVKLFFENYTNKNSDLFSLLFKNV